MVPKTEHKKEASETNKKNNRPIVPAPVLSQFETENPKFEFGHSAMQDLAQSLFASQAPKKMHNMFNKTFIAINGDITNCSA